MVEIFLSVNNGEQIIELPVIPDKIKVTKGQETETFETASGSQFALITPVGITTVSWSSFFPNKKNNYNFVRGTVQNSVFDYLYTIDSWQESKLPVRLVIWFDGQKSINIPTKCVITDYEIGTTGDMDYNIEFSKIPNNLIEDELTMAQYEELLGMINNLKENVDKILKRYNAITDEDFPEWAKPGTELLYNNGAIMQDGGLDLSYDMLRMITMNYRAQAYRGIVVYNYYDNNIPEYARGVIGWLIDNGCIKGDENGLLNLTDDLINAYVTVARAGGFGEECKGLAG